MINVGLQFINELINNLLFYYCQQKPKSKASLRLSGSYYILVMPKTATKDCI